MNNENKYCKLVLVSSSNNNKYYEMIYEGGSDFTINYGRIESTKTTLRKPIREWQSIYNSKVKKGYKDVTHTVSVTVEDKKDNKNTSSALDDIKDAKVAIFLGLMKKYTDGLVAKTYTVKAKDVTQAQVDEAQKHLNDLLKIDKKDTISINSKLLELYMVIPRYMSKVQNHLLPNIDLDKVLQQEQDNLDAMASQVNMIKTDSTDLVDSVVKKSNTLLDILEIEMETLNMVPSDIKYIVDQLGRNKIQGMFKIKKDKHTKVFNKWMLEQSNKETRHLIHGTRCTSVIPIIEQGLKIRPQGNYQFSGKVYGDGNYFSETCSKSLNYTGYDPDQVLLIFEVHTGKSYVYDGWYRGNSFTLNYKNLKDRGFDSTFVKAGGGLLNTEIIAYKEEQCHIKYILWLKR